MPHLYRGSWWTLEWPCQLDQVGNGCGGCEFRFVNSALQRFFERHHQFNAFERAESELVNGRRWLDRSARGEPRHYRGDRRAAWLRTRCHRIPTVTITGEPLFQFAPLQLARAFGARKVPV